MPLEYTENLNMSEIPGRSRERKVGAPVAGPFLCACNPSRRYSEHHRTAIPKTRSEKCTRASRWPRTAVRQLAQSNTQRRQSSSAAEVPASGVFLREHGRELPWVKCLVRHLSQVSTIFGGDPNTFFEPRLFLLRVAHRPLFLSFCSNRPQGDVAVGALLRARTSRSSRCRKHPPLWLPPWLKCAIRVANCQGSISSTEPLGTHAGQAKTILAAT